MMLFWYERNAKNLKKNMDQSTGPAFSRSWLKWPILSRYMIEISQSFLTHSVKMIYFKLKIDTFGNFGKDFRDLECF